MSLLFNSPLDFLFTYFFFIVFLFFVHYTVFKFSFRKIGTDVSVGLNLFLTYLVFIGVLLLGSLLYFTVTTVLLEMMRQIMIMLWFAGGMGMVEKIADNVAIQSFFEIMEHAFSFLMAIFPVIAVLSAAFFLKRKLPVQPVKTYSLFFIPILVICLLNYLLMASYEPEPRYLENPKGISLPLFDNNEMQIGTTNTIVWAYYPVDSEQNAMLTVELFELIGDTPVISDQNVCVNCGNGMRSGVSGISVKPGPAGLDWEVGKTFDGSYVKPGNYVLKANISRPGLESECPPTLACTVDIDVDWSDQTLKLFQ